MSLPHRCVRLIAILAILLLVNGLSAAEWRLESPSGDVLVEIEESDGVRFSVQHKGEVVIDRSQIDLTIRGRKPFGTSLGAANETRTEINETTTFVVPRRFKSLPHRCNELTLTAESGSHALVVRAYDRGVAYRWVTNLPGGVVVESELAEFRFPGTPMTWFPEEDSLMSHQERVYKHVPLGEIGPERFCSTGMVVEPQNGPKVYLSESDLASYPGMFLRGAEDHRGLVGKFAPYPLATRTVRDRDVMVTKAADYLAKTSGTRAYPWRVMILAEADADFLTNELIYQLAPPCELADTSWIKPGKVSWDWWNGINVTGVDFRVGVNTATYKHFIDFAAEAGLQYIILDEGWSKRGDLTQTVPEIDLVELIGHANDKGVGVILWTLWNELDANMIEALDKFEGLGVAGIKVDFMQRDDQPLVEFYHRTAAEAGKRRMLVDFHGSCKPFGIRRTYPNVISFEAVTGLENYKWSNETATPPQELVLPFIRMTAGPMDYTPGAMDNSHREYFHDIYERPMSLGTRCHQLAMYVVYESPLQMLADSPTQYRREPECLRFLSAVPTVWDETVVLHAELGEVVAIARRSGDAWFVGAMTNWTPRRLELDLSFLGDRAYKLEAWADGVNADQNAMDFKHTTQTVTSADSLQVRLESGGGWAGWLRPAND
ncbi:Retaining alpha-galactosidase precursor [Posidoniimonas corsicana]|uniref:Retaining alpha-galactosidase n=1 Tax=Posidoniimonas corsicana TaxID=1938618 RepID=A0A5C5UT53_9BACT|nr:glycoside hydrolase family 97 protein [Posidoniimonas corsicana]TWT29366.1 Retaining alpha-galactosidase precursor [Posidoniimonas corsicana]